MARGVQRGSMAGAGVSKQHPFELNGMKFYSSWLCDKTLSIIEVQRNVATRDTEDMLNRRMSRTRVAE